MAILKTTASYSFWDHNFQAVRTHTMCIHCPLLHASSLYQPSILIIVCFFLTFDPLTSKSADSCHSTLSLFNREAWARVFQAMQPSISAERALSNDLEGDSYQWDRGFLVCLSLTLMSIRYNFLFQFLFFFRNQFNLIDPSILGSSSQHTSARITWSDIHDQPYSSPGQYADQPSRRHVALPLNRWRGQFSDLPLLPTAPTGQGCKLALEGSHSVFIDKGSIFFILKDGAAYLVEIIIDSRV